MGTKNADTKSAEAFCGLISLMLGRIMASAASWWHRAAWMCVWDSEGGERRARCIELRAAMQCKRNGLARARFGITLCQSGSRKG